MVLSAYVKAYPFPGRPGTLLVFSTRKTSMLLLPEDLYRRLEAGQIPPEAEEPLLRLGILVRDREAEVREAFGFLDRANRETTGLTIAVILGMECNFRCSYCYEGSLKGPARMDRATEDRLVEFVDQRFLPGMDTVVVDFYGGEPLLYRDAIVRISGSLKRLVEERGGRFHCTLVTNGSLLTPEIVDELNPLGLMGARVTLDGPGDVHDRFRPFRSGRGSYEAIVANLKRCAGRTRIGLAGTYTRDNYRRFPELLDDLSDRGLGPEAVGPIQFSPVMHTTDEFAPPESCVGCASINEDWVAEATVFLREEVLKRGYRPPKIAPIACMVDLEYAFTVHYDGTLTKCPALVGHEQFVAGDLWEGFQDYRERFALDRLRTAPACRECEYLPLCLGGCRYMKYQREGRMGVECQRRFLDRTLGPILIQEARLSGKTRAPS